MKVRLRVLAGLSALVLTTTLAAQTPSPVGADCLSRYLPRCGPARTVCVNLHVFQDKDGRGNWQNTPADRARLEELIARVNGHLRMENCSPTDPCPGVIYAMKDMQIRVALKNIYFYRDSVRHTSPDIDVLQQAAFAAHPGAAHQLNIYLTHPNPVPGTPAVSAPSTNLAQHHSVVLMRTYTGGGDMSFFTATTLAAHLARTLGLLGTTDSNPPSESCDAASCEHLADVFCGGKCLQESRDPALSTAASSNNILSSSTGACFFSDLQIARMHRALATLSPRKYLEPCGCVKPPEPLALWLPLDDSGATTANVAGAAGAKSGQLSDGPQVIGKSLCFDGPTAAVTVAHDAGLQLGTGPFSIHAWVRRRLPDAGVRMIVDKRVSTPAIRGFAFYLFDGRISVQLADGSATNYGSTVVVPADGAFHHVAVTVDRSSATGGVFYLDGVPLSPAFNPTGRAGSLNNTSAVHVGMEATSKRNVFSGCLDEVAIVRRVLTAAEVRDIANAAGVGNCRLFLPPAAPVGLCSASSAVSAKNRICNASTEDRRFHYAYSPLPAGAGCNVAGPTGFTPQGGVIRVPAGRCIDLDVVIDRPKSMNAAGDRACYQISFTEAPDTVLYSTGAIEDRRNQCDQVAGDRNAPALPVGIEQTSYCDASQRATDWRSRLIASRPTPTPSFTASSPASGGNPGEYRTVQMNGAAGLIVAHSLNAETFVPATDGGIVEIDGAFDVRLTGPAVPVSVALLLEQDDRLFYGPRIPVSTTAWKSERQLALKASDFTTLPAGTGPLAGKSPDFSCAAKPIRIGYATILGGGAAAQTSVGIDNWCITVRTRCCPPAALTATGGTADGEPCCDEELSVDAGGNILLPADADPNTPPIVEYVNQSNGPVDRLYPQWDTAVDTWYPQLPCDGCIGGEVPAEALAPDLEKGLEDIGLAKTSVAEIEATLADVERIVDELTAGETISFSTLAPVSKPYVPPAIPHQNETVPGGATGGIPKEEAYVFGGRDIVFVHGLQIAHIANRLNPNSSDFKAANATWVALKDLTRDAAAANPEYYDGGYFKNVANEVWRPHIDQFLTKKRKYNRYLIVSYNCSERLEAGAAAILRQIADAMNFGTGVIDPLHPGQVVKDFGTPSLVLVTHSTGGLITDVAYTAAASNPNLGVSYIPKYTKGRVAAHSAFSGSRLATAALAASVLASKAAAKVLPPWTCNLSRLVIELTNPGVKVAECPMTPNVVLNSVLVDLVPLVSQRKWGASVRDSGIPTVVIGGAHPTVLWPLKYVLHPGLDDGVVTVNSQFAMQNSVALWPSGFRPRGLLGPVRVFDAGLFGPLGGRTLLNVGVAKVVSNTLNNPLRATGYYIDQVLNTAPAVVLALPPPLISSGPIPWTSASGMRQPVGSNYEMRQDLLNPATGISASFNPLWRAPRHYSYLFSTSDHSSGTTVPRADGNYGNTPFLSQPGGEKNWEETRVITDGAIYQGYAMQYAGDDGPLLQLANSPTPEERVRGLRVRYVSIRRFKIVWREAWIWKRLYYVLPDSDSKVQFDYVYERILK